MTHSPHAIAEATGCLNRAKIKFGAYGIQEGEHRTEHGSRIIRGEIYPPAKRQNFYDLVIEPLPLGVFQEGGPAFAARFAIRR